MANARHRANPTAGASGQRATPSESVWERTFPQIPPNVVPLRPSWRDRARAQWPSLSVQALAALSVGLMAFDRFTRGTWLLAFALAWAMLLRQTLPKRRVGWLQVRSKRTDMICLGLLFIGVVALAITTPTR